MKNFFCMNLLNIPELKVSGGLFLSSSLRVETKKKTFSLAYFYGMHFLVHFECDPQELACPFYLSFYLFIYIRSEIKTSVKTLTHSEFMLTKNN